MVNFYLEHLFPLEEFGSMRSCILTVFQFKNKGFLIPVTAVYSTITFNPKAKDLTY